MQIFIYLFMFVIVMSLMGTLFSILWPFIAIAIICSFVYTVFTRYKIKKQLNEEVKEQIIFEQKIETPKKNLDVIEAEYKERS